MDYNKINDNEYVSMIKEGSEEAKEILIEKYKNLINKISAYNYSYSKNCGLEQNDLKQEGLIGLLSAIDTYNYDKNVMFYTYATRCIETQIRSYIRSAKRNKNKFLNESLSLDNTLEDESDFYEILKDENSDPSIKVEEREYDNYLEAELKKYLTDFEQKVLYYKLKNLKNEEIAILLGKDKRSIENTISRIKIKYHNLIENVVLE